MKWHKQCSEVAKSTEGRWKWAEARGRSEKETNKDERSSCYVWGTRRESRPPPHWETLQEGNLRLKRQPQPPSVNKISSFSSLLAPFLLPDFFFLSPFLPLSCFIPLNCSGNTSSDFANLKMRLFGWGRMWHTSSQSSTQLITTELSTHSFFPATSAKSFCSRQHLLLHAASTHAQCTHADANTCRHSILYLCAGLQIEWWKRKVQNNRWCSGCVCRNICRIQPLHHLLCSTRQKRRHTYS